MLFSYNQCLKVLGYQVNKFLANESWQA